MCKVCFQIRWLRFTTKTADSKWDLALWISYNTRNRQKCRVWTLKDWQPINVELQLEFSWLNSYITRLYQALDPFLQTKMHYWPPPGTLQLTWDRGVWCGVRASSGRLGWYWFSSFSRAETAFFGTLNCVAQPASEFLKESPLSESLDSDSLLESTNISTGSKSVSTCCILLAEHGRLSTPKMAVSALAPLLCSMVPSAPDSVSADTVWWHKQAPTKRTTVAKAKVAQGDA